MKVTYLSLVSSRKLEEFLLHLPPHTRVKVAEDTGSSWIEVDVYGRYGWVQYAVWKATDELYMPDQHGAVGDDPISVRRAVSRINEIQKHRGGP